MRKYIFYITLLCFSVNLAGQNLSVKGRWNIKFGYARYKTHSFDLPPIVINDDDRFCFVRQSNYRLEANYGILKWLETGIYIGLQAYKYYPVIVENGEITEIFPEKKTYAPCFGLNANIHILPFFVKNQKCKWDFYIPVRYGGMYLTKWGDNKYGIGTADTGRWDFVGYIPNLDNKYRHEYGAGLGGAVYIKNIIGFYIEALGGQFSYAPEMFKSPYAIRVGITAKF